MRMLSKIGVWNKILEKKQTINVILLAGLFYLHEFVGFANSKFYVWELPLLTVCLLYAIGLTIEDKSIYKNKAIRVGAIWYGLYSIELILYGLVVYQVTEIYSKGYHLLTIMMVATIVVLVYDMRDDLARNLANAASICIVVETVSIWIYDIPIIKSELAMYGEFPRVGIALFWGVIETSISFFVLLLPLIYILINKRRKIFAIPLAIGIVMLAFTGSKTGILALAATVLILLIGLAKNRKQRTIIFAGYIVAIGVAVLVCYFVPLMHELVYVRFEEVINQLVYRPELDLHNSTSRRITFARMAFEMSWNSPWFGHGIFAFIKQGYGWDEVEHVFVNSHCNFTEVLYSFGLVGLILYYWLPIVTVVKGFRAKNTTVKTLVLGFLMGMFFVDLGAISFYFALVPFICYPIMYFIIDYYGKEQNS